MCSRRRVLTVAIRRSSTIGRISAIRMGDPMTRPRLDGRDVDARLSARSLSRSPWQSCSTAVIQAFVLHDLPGRGSSMDRTLAEGERLLIDKLTPRFAPYGRGDIVVLQPPASEDTAVPYIKRVMRSRWRARLDRGLVDVLIDGQVLRRALPGPGIVDPGQGRQVMGRGSGIPAGHGRQPRALRGWPDVRQDRGEPGHRACLGPLLAASMGSSSSVVPTMPRRRVATDARRGLPSRPTPREHTRRHWLDQWLAAAREIDPRTSAPRHGRGGLLLLVSWPNQRLTDAGTRAAGVSTSVRLAESPLPVLAYPRRVDAAHQQRLTTSQFAIACWP